MKSGIISSASSPILDKASIATLLIIGVPLIIKFTNLSLTGKALFPKLTNPLIAE